MMAGKLWWATRFVGGDARVEHAVELDAQPLFVINFRFAESCKLAETSRTK
jgi:hypothetical protein